MIAHGYWGGPGWWGIIRGLISLLFLVLVVVFIASMVRNRPGPVPGRVPAAIRILEERYARGNISRDEFLERRTALEPSHPPSPPP
jgi:putative membrane protein